MPSETCPNMAFGPFVIDRADERVLGPNGPVRLGQKAYRVLLSLAEQDGKLLTKDALFDSVWDGTIVSESALTSAVKELRRALGDESRTPRYIESVYGRGYRLIAPVRPVEGNGSPPAAAERSFERPAPASSEGSPPLVLVSDFRDEAVRERFPWYAAELREEVLSGLSRFREIQLVADNRPEGEAAAALRQERGYQLTATLLPDGDAVKVVARAKRLLDGRVLWAETMSLADTGTAGGVERIVRRIAGAAIPAVDEDLLAGLPQETGDLYDRYLLAKHRSFAAASFAEAQEAAAALESVIAERPGFALAYPPLVRLYNTDFGYTGLGSTGSAERAQALKLAQDGLAADRGNVHAYTVLGFCHLWHGEFELARTRFEQALALNPYYPVRLQECATGRMFMGDVAGARALMDKAIELNPVPDNNVQEDNGRLQLLEGNYEGARVSLMSAVDGSIWAELLLAIAELRLDVGDGVGRIGRWRERVARHWHRAPPPAAAEISAWIRRHHPFPVELADRFFECVEAALGD